MKKKTYLNHCITRSHTKVNLVEPAWVVYFLHYLCITLPVILKVLSNLIFIRPNVKDLRSWVWNPKIEQHVCHPYIRQLAFSHFPFSYYFDTYDNYISCLYDVLLINMTKYGSEWEVASSQLPAKYSSGSYELSNWDPHMAYSDACRMSYSPCPNVTYKWSSSSNYVHTLI